MKLIKVIKENEVKYFSTKRNAATFLGLQYQNINYYMNGNKLYKGWKIVESYDNIYTNEVDKL